MHPLLLDLESMLSTECCEAVEGAKNKYGPLVRTRLGHEMKLHLQHRHGGGQSTISVSVLPGFPESLQRLLPEPDDDQVADLIRFYETGLDHLQRGVRSVSRLLDLIAQRDSTFPKDSASYRSALSTVDELCSVLKARAERSNLIGSVITRIFSIQEDILGVYRHMSTTEGRVELYWGAIGVAAELLNVDVEALAVVVLIHELAHGFTDLGRDIDDQTWRLATSFMEADRAVIEGLAQYYSDLISESIGDTHAAAIHLAYLRLRRQQTGWYRVHDRWVQRYSAEVVRAALLKFRREGLESRPQFEDAMEAQREFLGATIRPVHRRVRADIAKYGTL
jgi:hypothetical protein